LDVGAFASGEDALSGLCDEVAVVAKTEKVALAALCRGTGDAIGGTLRRALGSGEGGESEDGGNDRLHCYW